MSAGGGASALRSLGRGADPRVQRGRRRLWVLTVGFLAAFSGVGLRLVQLMPSAPRARIASAEAGESAAATRRPDVVDRHSRLLATDLRLPSVYADPLLVPDDAAAARELARVLPGVEPAELEARFAKARRFAWVKHQITPAEQAAVLDLGIPGVGFRTNEHRVYPNGRTAGHVLGFVDIDNRGLAGIEHGIEAARGGTGPAAIPAEGAATAPDAAAAVAAAAPSGPLVGRRGPVALSVDARAQEVVADELGRAFVRFKAKGACGLVLDRWTGEVVALVSLPDFDPNRAGRAGEEERKNRCTGDTYELGSIFKIFAHAMALDTGKVSLRDRFDAAGALAIGRHRIRDDHAKNRVMTVPEIFIYSSNIGTARMAFAAGGAKPLEEFLRRAGFFERQPLEIPEVGTPQVPKRWAEVTTATVSFGHGLAITPLQFATALTAIAGDGTYAPATLLRREPGEPLPERRRLVSTRTAEDVRAMMWMTVAKGTGTRGRVDGYLVGGKTGTAEKIVPGRRGYQHGFVLASFAAVFPIEDPRYAVLAMLDEPTGDKGTYGHRYGGWTAAPTVSAIVARIGPLLGVPTSAPDAEAPLRDRVDPGRTLTAKSGTAGAAPVASAKREAGGAAAPRAPR